MKITGIEIREAIKHWTSQKTLLAKVFVDSGFAFGGEDKPAPEEVARQLEQASRFVAELESLQQQYNAAQRFAFDGREITLSVGVKLVAAYAQLSNLWRDYAERGMLNAESPYNPNLTLTRKDDEIHAVRRVSTAEASRISASYARKAGVLRGAVALANSASIEAPEVLGPMFSFENAGPG